MPLGRVSADLAAPKVQTAGVHLGGQQTILRALLNNNGRLLRNMATKTTRADFEKVFPSLMEDVLNDARKFNVPQNALDWFQKVASTG